MRPIYEFCLNVVGIEDGLEPEKRSAAYQADTIYCTNKDVAADFLRDQLANGYSVSGLAVLLSSISGEHKVNESTSEV